MHIIRKSILVSLLLTMLCIVSLDGHNNTLNIGETTNKAKNMDKKTEIQTTEAIKQFTKNSNNDTDSIFSGGKKWMLEQNIIIGY
jgi:hypothetical protein